MKRVFFRTTEKNNIHGERDGVPQTLDPLSSYTLSALPIHRLILRVVSVVQPVHTRAHPTIHATSNRLSTFLSLLQDPVAVYSCRWIILLRSCSRKQKAAGSVHATGYRLFLFILFFLIWVYSFSSSSLPFPSSPSTMYVVRRRLCRVNTLCFHEWDRIGQDGMRWVFWRQDELQTSRTMLLSHQEEVEWPYGSRRTGWFFGQTNFRETYRVFYNLTEGASMLPEDSFRVLAFDDLSLDFRKRLFLIDENGMDYRSIDLRWFYQRWFELVQLMLESIRSIHWIIVLRTYIFVSTKFSQ